MVATLSSKVQYAYADGSANTIRRTEVTYPDSSSNRKVTLDYGTGGGADDRLSRVAKLNFTSTDVALYKYLGLATPVQVDYAEPDVRWDLITGSGANPYAGLDRFGRVIDNLWQKYSGTPTDLDRIKHGYDRASNRLWRENTVSKALGTPKYFDELYSYDGLNRLKNMERGQLSGSPPSSITNLKFEQDWGLDPTGNWKDFKENSDGGIGWDIDQTRAASEVNEITDITSTPTWITPGYDNNGNMTTMPQPASPGSSYTAVYDAWNRLVRLSDGSNKVQENAYDGLTRRTLKKSYDPPGTLAETRHYYYSDAWQVLEERLSTNTTFDRQFVWGLRYIDDLVLRDHDQGSPFGIERHYALQDPNWNVTAAITATATVAGRFAYSAYGTPTTLDVNFAPASLHSLDWETLFAGYRWDSAASVYSIRHRVLNPQLGVWLTRDAIARRNLLEYAMSRPVVLFDPNGLEPTTFGGPGITPGPATRPVPTVPGGIFGEPGGGILGGDGPRPRPVPPAGGGGIFDPPFQLPPIDVPIDVVILPGPMPTPVPFPTPIPFPPPSGGDLCPPLVINFPPSDPLIFRKPTITRASCLRDCSLEALKCSARGSTICWISCTLLCKKNVICFRGCMGSLCLPAWAWACWQQDQWCRDACPPEGVLIYEPSGRDNPFPVRLSH